MRRTKRSSVRRIGYVLNAFPVVSETFILNELRAMRLGGVEVAILPLSPRRDTVRHAGIEELDFPVVRTPAPGVRGNLLMLTRHLAFGMRRPRVYWRLVRSELLPGLWSSSVRSQGGRRHLRRRLRRFALAGWIAEAAARLGVVHFHAHYAKEPLRVTRLVCRANDLPYSFAAHAKDLYTSSSASLAGHLAGARFAVTCHAHGQQYLKSIAAPGDADKVELIHHGIDAGLFLSEREATPRGPLILAVGRLTPKKGFEDLIEACSLLAASGRPTRCAIVGEGRLERTLREQIAATGLEKLVRIEPFVPQEALVKWYRRASVVAAPCVVRDDGNRDGIPNVVLEAMASGRAVVSTPVGGIPEVIESGRNGLLVPPNAPRQLAEALGGLVEHPQRAWRIGEEARESVSQLDFRQTVEPLVDRFRRLAGDPVAYALECVEQTAWWHDGISRKAKKVLGIRPRRDSKLERRIAEAVRPGLEANAWRSDLERLARRRVWDEVYKARRLSRFGALESWSGRRVLDLGCGRGGLTVGLVARGATVVGFDLRWRNCKVTRLRGRRYRLSIPTVVGRAEALPFVEGSFDHVFCLEVLEHVRDPIAVLKEIRRVLTRSGTCTITVINRWAHLDPHYHLWGLNFLPRSLAGRYIALRGRAKRSWRDLQTLEEMHYFSFGRFVEIARTLGFRVEDPEGRRKGLMRAVGRRLSLGFNTATLTLVAVPEPE